MSQYGQDHPDQGGEQPEHQYMLSSFSVLVKTHGNGEQAKHNEGHKGNQSRLEIIQTEIGLQLAGQGSGYISKTHDQKSQENGGRFKVNVFCHCGY
jgi:hypothetical protein